MPGSQKVFINDRRPSFPFSSLPASRRAREGHTPWVPSRHPRFCAHRSSEAPPSLLVAQGQHPRGLWTRGTGRPGPRGVPGHGRPAPPQPRGPQHPPACALGVPGLKVGRVLCGLCGFGVVGGSVGQILVMGSSSLQHHGAGSTQSRRAASSPIPGRGLLAAALTAAPLAAPPRGLPRVSGGT